MTSRSVVFAEPVRTAIGTLGGSLKDIPASDLGATTIRAAVARAGDSISRYVELPFGSWSTQMPTNPFTAAWHFLTATTSDYLHLGS